jgi:hypothetical protein
MERNTVSAADPKTCQTVKSFLGRHNLEYTEKEEQYCDKLTVRSGAHIAHVSVYNSGRITIGGGDGPLRSFLNEMKAAVENGQALPGQLLPFEIDRFPEIIKDRVPDCDPVIIRFVEEAISCVRANAILAAAFMLGAASEKAINQMIYIYAESIREERNRERFTSRINQKTISKKMG